MAFKMKYPIQQDLLPICQTSPRRRAGIKMPRVKFIVAHDTGNCDSTAKNNVKYYKNSYNQQSSSAHLFVDDKDIIECIPALLGTPEKAWHVLYNKPLDNKLFGGDANDIAIGVEMCFGRTKVNTLESYKRYVWVLAYICYKFNINPKTNIVGHSKLDPGRKVDPENALKYIGKNFPNLIADVVKELAECTAPVVAEVPKVEKVTPPEVKKEMSKHFSDVPKDHYSADAVDHLFELGLLVGKEKDGDKAVLGFGENVTIERVATIISRAIKMNVLKTEVK